MLFIAATPPTLRNHLQHIAMALVFECERQRSSRFCNPILSHVIVQLQNKFDNWFHQTLSSHISAPFGCPFVSAIFDKAMYAEAHTANR
jgi:hypothetical protein